MDRIEVEDRTRRIRVVFSEPPRTGRRVATLRGIHKAYSDNIVYAGIDFDIERGDRVALVGVNGAGKSTLLRILAGVLPFERGERTLGAHVAVHYYAQHQVDALNPERAVLAELEAVAPEAAHPRLRALLGAFLFSGAAVDKKVSVLSGGEKARLALAKMLVRPTALLCLDEPTNHLDLASREVLEDALAGFGGTIVFISHDRYFINRIVTKIVEIAGGSLTTYLGDYDDYLGAKMRAQADAGEGRGPLRPSEPHSSGAAPAPPPRRQGGRRGLAELGESSKVGERAARDRSKHRRRVDPEVRELRRRLEEVERQIHALEERLRQLGETLGDPSLYADGERVRAVALERKSAEEQVAWLMREWEALSTELAAHE